jgi:hypothetical protein
MFIYLNSTLSIPRFFRAFLTPQGKGKKKIFYTWGRIGKGVKRLCQEMTFDDPGASKDCARKRAHTEKVVNGSERVKIRIFYELFFCVTVAKFRKIKLQQSKLKKL